MTTYKQTKWDPRVTLLLQLQQGKHEVGLVEDGTELVLDVLWVLVQDLQPQKTDSLSRLKTVKIFVPWERFMS